MSHLIRLKILLLSNIVKRQFRQDYYGQPLGNTLQLENESCHVMMTKIEVEKMNVQYIRTLDRVDVWAKCFSVYR